MCWEAVVVTVYMTSVCPLPERTLPGLRDFFSWALTSMCNTSLAIGAQPLHVKPLSRSLRSLIKTRFSLCCHIWYGFPACSLGWGPFTFLISCSCLWSPVIPLPHSFSDTDERYGCRYEQVEWKHLSKTFRFMWSLFRCWQQCHDLWPSCNGCCECSWTLVARAIHVKRCCYG